MATNSDISLFIETDKIIFYYENCLAKLYTLESKGKEKVILFYKENKLQYEDSGIESVITKYNERLLNIKRKIIIIKSKVNSELIKISLFGKVSVGKSKIINVLLKRDILTSASCDTTSCFVKIHKSLNCNNYIVYEEKKEKFETLEALKLKMKELTTHLTNVNSTQLETNEYVDVYLNINDVKLFDKQVEIIDTPGFSNTDQITEYIHKEALSADIFIYVMSNKMGEDEMNFFSLQSEESLKPDIFVLINGWDNSDDDDPEDTEISRTRIINDLINFAKRFKICSTEIIKERTFFISAKEMYNLRILPKPIFIKSELSKKRQEQFYSFEKLLEECITNHQYFKINRHRPEINNIITSIKNEKRELKKKIMMFKDENKINELNQLLNILKQKKKELERTINQEIENKSKKLEEKVTYYEKNLNKDNIAEIEKQCMIIIEDVNKTLISVIKIIYEKLNKIRSENENILSKYSISKIDSNPTLMDNLAEKTRFQAILPKYFMNTIIDVFKRFYAFLTWSNCENDCLTDSIILENNKTKLVNIQTELKTKIEEVKNNLTKYIGKEIENMKKISQFKLDYEKWYWNEVEQLF